MLVFQNLVPLAALLSIAFASPIERSEGKPLEVRQSATTCGSTSYTAAQVRAAFNAGYNYYTADDTAGSSTYPHTYNNYECVDKYACDLVMILKFDAGASISPSTVLTRSSLS